MNVFFQSIGTLFSYNLGLPFRLASYSDIKVTLGTRHLLLYVYGTTFAQHCKDFKIRMITYPTFIPFKFSLAYGSAVARVLVRSSIFKKLLSKFDVVHLNDRAYPYTKAAVNIKKATVLTLHWLPSKIDEDVCAKLDALVAPTETTSRIVEKTLGTKPEVIYHGVETTLFNTQITQTEAREYLGLPLGRRVVFWNGRLDPIKDPKTLIDAIPIVTKEIPDSLFVIKARTNRSQVLQYIKKRIRDAGIEQNVRMMFGWDFITKMPYYYRSADLCVHTSLSECCSLVLIEAMACGVPIVVTDIPAVYDPVGNAGLHFEPKNSDDLAEKIIRLLCDEKLRIELQEKDLRRISELGLTWKKASERYRDLYLSLM